MPAKIDETFTHKDPANYYTVAFSRHEFSLSPFETFGEAIVFARQEAAAGGIPFGNPAVIIGTWVYSPNTPCAKVSYNGRVRYM